MLHLVKEVIEIKLGNTANFVNDLDIQQLLRVDSGKTVPKQCGKDLVDEWTHLSEEIAQFKEQALIDISVPSLPK